MLSLGDLSGKGFLVLGVGRSGLSAYRCLQACGARVSAWDDDAERRRRAGMAHGILLGNPSRPDTFADLDAVVVSPGVPHLYPGPSPSVARALEAGVPLDNDIGLFLAAVRAGRFSSEGRPPQVIAVTGSNGKSTTSALINHVLNRSGRKSSVAGNIGNAVLDLPAIDGFVVLEVSSYQAELARCLDPDIAVFLNFSPDHLDRHGGPGGYFAAKSRLFAGGSLKGAAIGVDDLEGRYLANRVRGRLGPTGVSVVSVAEQRMPAHSGVICRDRRLAEFSDGQESFSADLSGCTNLQGIHNWQNAGAAYSACRFLGLGGEEIVAGMESFPGLAHRMRILGTFRGIQCVNDSKATNARSSEMALTSFRRIRWIAGGQGKEGGLSGISAGLENVEKVYLIGSSAQDFAEQLGPLEHEMCGDMARAVDCAFRDAAEGDTILLSPAAASFDQYSDFEERGDDFEREVRRRTASR